MILFVLYPKLQRKIIFQYDKNSQVTKNFHINKYDWFKIHKYG